MQIDRIFYPIKTLGYGSRIGIWTVGCPRRCVGCSNPELWAADRTRDIKLAVLFDALRVLKNSNRRIDGVTISGGEPFLQADELAELVLVLKKDISHDILVYSGCTIEELHLQRSPAIDQVLGSISALIDGPYIEEQNDNCALRGSANQKIHVLNKLYRRRYERLLSQPRTVQTVFSGTTVISFGIPARDFRADMDKHLQRKGITHERNLTQMAP